MKVCVVNKIDGLHHHNLVPQLAAAQELGEFDEIVPVSARDGEGVDVLRDLLVARMPEGPPLFPSDEDTDEPLEITLAELVREQALRVTRQEVPHSIAVVVDEIEREGDLTKIHASLVVERDSQKGILIGHGGETLKAIGTAARMQMEPLAGHASVPGPPREGPEGMAARPARARPARPVALGYVTITVPVMDEWILQWNGYVPGSRPADSPLNVSPPSIDTSTCVPSIVNVCVTESLFSIVIEEADAAAKQSGENARSWIVTTNGSSPVRSVGVVRRASGRGRGTRATGGTRRPAVVVSAAAARRAGERGQGDHRHEGLAHDPASVRSAWVSSVAMSIAGSRSAPVGGSATMDPMSQAAQIQPSDRRPVLSGGAEAQRLIARTVAVDAVGLEERAASLAKRSIKKSSKLWALDLAIRCMDLTTLEGTDTVGKIVALCSKAIRPDPVDPSIPSVAAVCLYPQLVPVAAEQLKGTGVHVASVAGAFPAGLGPLDSRLREIAEVVELGADEVDIVLNRSLFLGGRYAQAYDELVAAREAAGAAHLKVILETGELGSYDRVRQASMLAMAAGADFIKTSTGKIGTGATLPSALCMMEAARDFHRQTGVEVGIKVAGGVRASKQSIQYLTILFETLGANWMTPDRFRIGASTLLNDVLMQIDKERTGRYQGRDYFTVD